MSLLPGTAPGSTVRRRPASLASRLLAPLLLVAGGVMAAFAVWALVQRERTLVGEARRETQAYATALGLALEGAFRDPDRTGVPEIIERISRQATIYGVVVYDPLGNPLFGPGSMESTDLSTPEQVRAVLASGGQIEFERAQDEVAVYSVVRPIFGDSGQVVGAFEVLQPLDFVEQEKAQTRLRFFLNTIVLLAAVTVLLLWLVRRLVSEPLSRFSDDVRALGTGRLDHRVEPTAVVSELASVADALNQMAAGLESARGELVRGAAKQLTLERQVRQAEKMAMIGQLAAGLAHEIGAPLHVIRGRDVSSDGLSSGTCWNTSDGEHGDAGTDVETVLRERPGTQPYEPEPPPRYWRRAITAGSRRVNPAARPSASASVADAPSSQ